jgi:hypothetical protein
MNWQPGQTPRWLLPTGLSPGLRRRLQTLQSFGLQAQTWLQQSGYDSSELAIQLHDEDPGVPCLRFDAPRTADGGPPLIPDPYALASAGFAGVRASFAQDPLPPWAERLPIAIWRGASTGTPQLGQENLGANRRIQLCRWSQQHPTLLDARLSAIVQAEPDCCTLLQPLLAPRLAPWQLALHRWLVEIAGNVNSWGLLWKLLSGSCVLRVASDRRQWYHHRLEPWVHVVPLAADLSDLGAVLQWCRAHPERCAGIAAAGRQLGLQVVATLKQDQRAAVKQWVRHWMTPAPGGPPIG